MTIRDLTLDISESGKFAELRLDSGRILAQFLIHGLLKKVAENVSQDTGIIPGRANIFRGEVYQIAPYEYLDRDSEVIIEKI